MNLRQMIEQVVVEYSHDKEEVHRISPCAARAMLRELVAEELLTPKEVEVANLTLQGLYIQVPQRDWDALAAGGVPWLCKQASLESKCGGIQWDTTRLLRSEVTRGLRRRSGYTQRFALFSLLK